MRVNDPHTFSSTADTYRTDSLHAAEYDWVIDPDRFIADPNRVVDDTALYKDTHLNTVSQHKLFEEAEHAFHVIKMSTCKIKMVVRSKPL